MQTKTKKMVPYIRLGHYSSIHHNANQSYDLGNPFSDIDLNISSKTKKKNVMPRYRKKSISQTGTL
jgi:hypothetical protein